jgi:hypothetical protein
MGIGSGTNVQWILGKLTTPLHESRNSFTPQRLDPAVMHVSCIQAGTLLARLGRPEVKHCIDGLEQYSYSYEEAGDQANEMKRTYHQAIAGEPEFNHMALVVPRMVPDSSSMAVDEQDIDGDGSPHVRAFTFAFV